MTNKYWRAWRDRNPERARRQNTERMRRYRAANPEKYREMARAAVAKVRARLLKLYGETCSLCGFGDRRALTLDHINRNGNAERREIGERGVYRKALREHRPDLYRTLCMNCQFISRRSLSRFLEDV